MAIDTTSLASLLDALKAWLQANPDGDLQEFAAEHDCTVEDVSDAWNTYFTADFSRDYDLNTTQGGSQSVSQGVHYSPAPPPHSATPVEYKEYLTQEINNYQQFTTINNIEDNSFNQQIIAGGDVNQDIDIDNSDNIVGEDGVLVRDSNLDDTNVNTGDRAVQDSEGVLTGDVTTEAGEGGQAQTGINFGEGDLQQNQQDQDVEINKTGDNTGGDGGSADGTGGAGTGAGGDGGAGGDADADGGDGAGGIVDDGGAEAEAGAEADAEAGGGDGGAGVGVGGAGDGGDGGDGGGAGDAFDVSQTGPVF